MNKLITDYFYQNHSELLKHSEGGTLFYSHINRNERKITMAYRNPGASEPRNIFCSYFEGTPPHYEHKSNG